MKIGPLVLFEPEVSDALYAPVFHEVLRLLRPMSEVLAEQSAFTRQVEPDAEHSWQETERQLAEYIEIEVRHLERVQVARNKLVDHWPRKPIQRVHRRMTAAITAYGYALADDLRYQETLLNGPQRQLERHRRNALQWDKLAASYASKLVGELRNIDSQDSSIGTALIGDVDLDAIPAIQADDKASDNTINRLAERYAQSVVGNGWFIRL